MTVGRADLIELFGEEHLVTVERAAVTGIGLGPATVRVLTDIGLPAAPARGLPPDAVPLLSVAPPVPVGRYVCFGRLLEDAFEACIDPRTDAVVGRASREEVFGRPVR